MPLEESESGQNKQKHHSDTLSSLYVRFDLIKRNCSRSCYKETK